jgi:hypothetical protein
VCDTLAAALQKSQSALVIGTHCLVNIGEHGPYIDREWQFGIKSPRHLCFEGITCYIEKGRNCGLKWLNKLKFQINPVGRKCFQYFLSFPTFSFPVQE